MKSSASSYAMSVRVMGRRSERFAYETCGLSQGTCLRPAATTEALSIIQSSSVQRLSGFEQASIEVWHRKRDWRAIRRSVARVTALAGNRRTRTAGLGLAMRSGHERRNTRCVAHACRQNYRRNSNDAASWQNSRVRMPSPTSSWSRAARAAPDIDGR